MELCGKHVVVAGLARSGMAAIELLLEHGAHVRATDSQPLSALPGVAAELERLGVPFTQQAPEVFAAADMVVLSPGVPADLGDLAGARRRDVPVIGEVELAGAFLQGPTIGITGANGKTTTTALVGHILREAGVPVQVGGNIGRPVTAMVATSRREQWNVLELSSFQLETIERFRATIGVAINVTPDHLDRHHTFAGYASAKRRLFETQREGDRAVLNADDATCAGFAARTCAEPFWFSQNRAVRPGIFARNGVLLLEGKPLIEAAAIPLRGRHNVENTMAAAAAAHLAGVSNPAIAAAVRTFPGVEHRLEYVRTVSGIDFYNDSKATNVDATLKAVDAFPGGLWIILGGKDKGSDYRPLREPLAGRARAALLIGAAAPKIASELAGSVRLIQAGTLAEAVRLAYAEAVSGDTVLLAPACASFDQFENFEHRGRAFRELANGLATKE